jgi:beta-xylosidase
MGEINGGATGQPVLYYRKPNLPSVWPTTPATSDEFSSSKLGLQWQWHANHRHDWYSLSARDGWLRLFAQGSPASTLDRVPNLLLQKFPARAFIVETTLDLSGTKPGDEAGLIVMGRAHAALALRRTESGIQVVFRSSGTMALEAAAASTARLRVAVDEAGMCLFKFSLANDEWITVADRFQAQAGFWIGAKVGLYALGSSHADFDFFRFHPPSPTQ